MLSATEPSSLYHFADASDPVRKGWIEDLLLNSRAYFRQREQLNDPSELRPTFVVHGSERELREYVRKIRRFDQRRLSPAARMLEENRLLNRIRSSPRMAEEQLHDLLGRIGVFCLTDSLENVLMWAHYANGSRGIAIEFDSSQGLFAVAQRVTYSDEPPVINRLQDEWNLLIDKSMLWKSKQWEYEREWRVIARFRDAVRQEWFIEQHHPAATAREFLRSQDGPGHYLIPPSAIRRVVLGVRTTFEDEAWLRSVLAQRPGTVQVVRTVLTHGTVKLVGE